MSSQPSRNRNLALSLVAIVLGMVMLAYASVPLYRLFCQITGFGGTTQVASAAPAQVIDRTITVRFNADIDPNLPWEFKPEQLDVKVKVGEQVKVFYSARNTATETTTGTAIFNVTPHKAGPYFNKIQCFCFEDQSLKPGESKQFPVLFFIDPAIMKSPELNDVETITLSYTFFQVKPSQNP